MIVQFAHLLLIPPLTQLTLSLNQTPHKRQPKVGCVTIYSGKQDQKFPLLLECGCKGSRKKPTYIRTHPDCRRAVNQSKPFCSLTEAEIGINWRLPLARDKYISRPSLSHGPCQSRMAPSGGVVEATLLLNLNFTMKKARALSALTSPPGPRSSHELTSAGRRVEVRVLCARISHSHFTILPTERGGGENRTSAPTGAYGFPTSLETKRQILIETEALAVADSFEFALLYHVRST